MKKFNDRIVDAAKQSKILGRLHQDDIKELISIVYNEHEGWDGEPVEIEFVVRCMERRFEAVGLIPSRN